MSESDKWMNLCDPNCQQKSVFPNCSFCDIALEYKTSVLSEVKQMDDYISRQAFRESLINTPFYPRCKATPDLLTSVQDRLNDTIELLDNFPPADVRPVVRGRWSVHMSELFPADSTIECDQCHEVQSAFISDSFCPNCGADMRGGDTVGNEKD